MEKINNKIDNLENKLQNNKNNITKYFDSGEPDLSTVPTKSIILTIKTK